MKYPVYNTIGGPASVNFNIEDLKTKMINHISLFDSYFGTDNWAYTGSSAVAIYTSKYNPSDLSKINRPNDLDILFADNRRLNEFRYTSIGDYVRPTNTPTKSASFTNRLDNTVIDVLVEKTFKKVTIDGIPLVDINTIYARYTDPLYKRSEDEPKAQVLKSLIDNNLVDQLPVTVPEEEIQSPVRSSGTNLMSRFEDLDELSPPKINRTLNFD